MIRGKALASIVVAADLGRPPGFVWPDTVVLLARPDAEALAATPAGDMLLTVWRRLFRARVAWHVQTLLDTGAIDARGLDERIARIGRTEFEEIRLVLRQDGWLLPPRTDAVVYQQFAAIFLDLTCFAPALRPHTFPALEGLGSVEALLAMDVDAMSLFESTRPTGAPSPENEPVVPETEAEGDGAESSVEPIDSDVFDPRSDQGRPGRLAARAREATARGNSVRAALVWMEAARVGGEGLVADVSRYEARAAIRQLSSRLQTALFARADEAGAWTEALTPLLARAPRGFWTPEARLLYDLQAVCLDHERQTFRTDLLGWIFSLGRRPLEVAMPHLREVAISNHLRNAARRLPKVRLAKDQRARLDALLRPAARRAEVALREQFRPWIDSTLESTWVRPRNLPERVAYRKFVEELLDPIVGRGFLTLGDLRDYASRSNLKLPDLAGPLEFWRGNRLLESDRVLGRELDGVHRRGEVYLRWFQRFSALAFSTRAGRFFTLFVALPFGGAFVLLEGLQHIAGAAAHYFTGSHVHLMNVWSVLVLGAVALGVINYVRFRHEVVALVRTLGRSLRSVFVELPARVLNNPLLRRIIESPAAEAIWRIVVAPGLYAAGFGAAALILRLAPPGPFLASAVGFVAASFALNTRIGRALEEAAFEGLVRAWRELVFDYVPGLFRLVMAAFQRVLEALERLIYAVDEWLRFHSGQSKFSLVVKAVLGLVWFGVAYLARIYVNLLIEPQINPIKHFPVVTVSHKIILPMSVFLTRILSAPLQPFLGKFAADVVAGTNVLLLPGVFGFLVWELKANWRLYEANRAETLAPVVVGSHGETMARLLRPGLHSGTLPRIFARLRRAERVERKSGRDKGVLKQREALHHVEESVRTFIARDFLALLHEGRAPRLERVSGGAIRLATNRLRIELIAEDVGGRPDERSLWIDIEEREGVLAAGVSEPGWLDALEPDERRTLDDALVGLFKMSGVVIVHTPGEPVASLPALPELATRNGDPAPTSAQAFAKTEVPWESWVRAWELERSEGRESPGLPSVLPPLDPPSDQPSRRRAEPVSS